MKEEIYKATLCEMTVDGRHILVLFSQRAITLHGIMITDTKEYLERRIGVKAMTSILHSPKLAFDEELTPFAEDSDAAVDFLEKCESAPIDLLTILAESQVGSTDDCISIQLYEGCFTDDMIEKLGLRLLPDDIAQNEE